MQFNISSFFGNSNKSGMAGFNYSDYALIRNGSYKKLMKSYYSKQADTSSVENKPGTKKEYADTTGLSKMRSEAEGLKSAAKNVTDEDLWKKKNGAYDMDQIAGAVTSLANEYNQVLTQGAKVTTKDVTQQINYMTSLSRTMSNALAKVGVTVGGDGSLSVDEDVLKKADIKDVKAMFQGAHSYGAQLETKASAISSAALRNSSLYSSSGTWQNSYMSNYNQWI